MTALMHTTQIQVYISVNVTVNADRIGWVILALIAILFRQIQRLLREVSLLVNDFIESARFTAAIFAIGFKSLAYGLIGVRL
ncbi:MAG: hypothetical protein HS126_00110 [Anaerolineales bacterium]|nr:hypothetical protein [Anaerolineales bacterium]